MTHLKCHENALFLDRPGSKNYKPRPSSSSHLCKLTEVVARAVTGSHFEPNYYKVSKTRTKQCTHYEEKDAPHQNTLEITWVRSAHSPKVVMKGEGLTFSTLLHKWGIYTEEEKSREGIFSWLSCSHCHGNSKVWSSNIDSYFLSKVPTNWHLIILKISSWETRGHLGKSL